MRLQSCVPWFLGPPVSLLGLWQAQYWHLPWPGTDTQTPHAWSQATLREALHGERMGWQGNSGLHPGA